MTNVATNNYLRVSYRLGDTNVEHALVFFDDTSPGEAERAIMVARDAARMKRHSRITAYRGQCFVKDGRTVECLVAGAHRVSGLVMMPAHYLALDVLEAA